MARSGQRSPTELASNHLVSGLLREGELTPNVAREILEVIQNPGGLLVWERELNIYILNFNFEERVVRLDDDLDPSPGGTFLMSLDETLALLEDYINR